MTMQTTYTIKSSSKVIEQSTDAKKSIVRSHLGLVKYVTGKFGFKNTASEHVLEENDLVQFGLLGLLDAVEKFDPSKGVKFESYAITRIRGTILDELRKLDWVPRSVRKKARTADRVMQESESQANRLLTAQEIADKLSLTLDEYHDLITEAKGAIMDHRVSYDEEIELIENIAADSSSDPYEVVSAEETREKLIEAIEALSERERLIITLYYYEGLTFREIGAILKVSESRVFQIHTTVISGLRKKLIDLL
jgi:RNA polymerase sigma factor for flagellar operon FliA